MRPYPQMIQWSLRPAIFAATRRLPKCLASPPSTMDSMKLAVVKVIRNIPETIRPTVNTPRAESQVADLPVTHGGEGDHGHVEGVKGVQVTEKGVAQSPDRQEGGNRDRRQPQSLDRIGEDLQKRRSSGHETNPSQV